MPGPIFCPSPALVANIQHAQKHINQCNNWANIILKSQEFAYFNPDSTFFFLARQCIVIYDYQII